MSFYVVEFLEGKAVAVISHVWYIGTNLAAWPLMKPSKFNHCLRNNLLLPGKKCKMIEVNILKKTDDYANARAYERRAEYEVKFTSNEANEPAGSFLGESKTSYIRQFADFNNMQILSSADKREISEPIRTLKLDLSARVIL